MKENAEADSTRKPKRKITSSQSHTSANSYGNFINN